MRGWRRVSGAEVVPPSRTNCALCGLAGKDRQRVRLRVALTVAALNFRARDYGRLPSRNRRDQGSPRARSGAIQSRTPLKAGTHAQSCEGKCFIRRVCQLAEKHNTLEGALASVVNRKIRDSRKFASANMAAVVGDRMRNLPCAVAIVIPRAFSSGALSILSKSIFAARPISEST
eukprot:1182628-Prorocentrum_minimum.AAC.1